MVDCGLARLNEYHFLSLWHTCRQLTIIIRCYNWNPWRCGTIVELVLVLGYAVLLHELVVPILMLFICFFISWIIFLSVVETLVIVSGGQEGGIFTIFMD